MKLISLYYIILFAIIKLVYCKINLPSDIVFTTSGYVQGFIGTNFDGVMYSAFKGIPYGDKPKRYQEPVFKTPVSHVIQSVKDGPECMQYDNHKGKVVGSEDCLSLNIFTPFLNLTKPFERLLPILFWVHGGAFLTGSTESCKFGAGSFITDKIVVVTINYRLGALGWALLNNTEIPGNAGLKDQLLALKWVRQNIDNFGGDSSRITLGGQSAGSISATAHAISNQSTGLFHQILAMSGTICNGWGYYTRSEAHKNAESVAKALNNNTDVKSEKELVEILSTAPAEEITELSYTMSFIFPLMRSGMDLNSPHEIFLNQCYYKKFQNGNYFPVPTMLGFTDDEVLLFVKPLNDLILDIEQYLNKLDNSNILSRIFSMTIGRLGLMLIRAFIQFLIYVTTEIFFHVGVDLCQRNMCSTRNATIAPVYYYSLNFDGKNYSYHWQHQGITQFHGVAHEDDIPYVFESCPNIFTYPEDPNHPVNIKRRQINKLISNFIKYGNPTPLGNKDPLLNVTWPNSCDNGHSLIIGDKLIAENKRPTGIIASLLMPVAKYKEPSQSDCFRDNV